jgi:hypothetical protein
MRVTDISRRAIQSLDKVRSNVTKDQRVVILSSLVANKPWLRAVCGNNVVTCYDPITGTSLTRRSPFQGDWDSRHNPGPSLQPQSSGCYR